MKKFLFTLIAAAALVSASFIGGGCASSGSSGNTNSPVAFNTNTVRGIVTLAVSTGVDAAIIAEGSTNVTPYLTVVSAALSEFLGGTNFSPVALQVALEGLPIQGLNKTYADMVINAVMNAYNVYYASYVQNAVDGSSWAVAILSGIRDGIVEDIGASPAVVKAKLKARQAKAARHS